MSGMSVQIVEAKAPNHFEAAASLHAQGIKEGFLSSLGASFLTVLYEGIATNNESGVFVAIEENRVLGFISYARDVKTCFKSVLRSNFTALVRTVSPNIFKPVFYKNSIETLLYPLVHRNTPKGNKPQNHAGIHPELLSMAVAENARGKNIGKLLVQALDEKMIEMGLPGYFVITHATDERSNGFYLGRGFLKTNDYTQHGKPMNEYYRSL